MRKQDLNQKLSVFRSDGGETGDQKEVDTQMKEK
jgi:hypothetical protein